MDIASPTASFRHILVGVDGSDPACRAADTAARLALALDASLTFLAVAKEVRASKDIEDYAKLEGIETPRLPLLRSDAEACLTAAVAAARDLGLVGVERVIQTGDVGQMIARVAQTHGADCIVLGRSARGAVRKLVAGSVANAVGKATEGAVLLIP